MHIGMQICRENEKWKSNSVCGWSAYFLPVVCYQNQVEANLRPSWEYFTRSISFIYIIMEQSSNSTGAIAVLLFVQLTLNTFRENNCQKRFLRVFIAYAVLPQYPRANSSLALFSEENQLLQYIKKAAILSSLPSQLSQKCFSGFLNSSACCIGNIGRISVGAFRKLVLTLVQSLYLLNDR